MTRSQMCSLSSTSFVRYRARADRMAIRPHSEHSFRATSSFVSVAWSMMNSWLLGRAEGSISSPSTVADSAGVF